MEIQIEPGKYVAAISGGVDSMVLLDLLIKVGQINLVVAHYNHGIRGDSLEDELLVKRTAKKYGLEFVCEQGHLGPKASEAQAREARYKFLRNVMQSYKAKAIITAHHQDDLIETMFLNIIRGTKRKGLTPFDSQIDILRPLVNYTKQQITEYARQNHIIWREDSTNTDQKYRRNYLRHSLLAGFGPNGRDQIININQKMRLVNHEIDSLVGRIIKPELNRPDFILLPFDVSCEVMAAWLRSKGLADFTSENIERLVIASKTMVPGKRVDVINGYCLIIRKQSLALGKADC